MEKKILFLDLDGTLLNDGKEISPGNERAIRQALDLGHKIVINTGRALSSAVMLADQLKLNQEGCYAITYNGACIFDLHNRKTVYSRTIARDYVRFLLDTAKDMGLHGQTYSDTDVVCASDNSDLQSYLKFTKMTAVITEDPCGSLSQDPCKVLIVDYRKRGLFPAYMERIQDWAVGKVDYFHSCEELLEIVAPGVSKGNAVHKLCEILQIPLTHTIAAGDAENDISMISAAQVGVVMKNADPQIYPYGNYITKKDNNHDGVAEIIEKFMLN